MSISFSSVCEASLLTTLSRSKTPRLVHFIVWVELYIIVWLCLLCLYDLCIELYGLGFIIDLGLIRARGLIQTWHSRVLLFDMYVLCGNLGISLNFVFIICVYSLCLWFQVRPIPKGRARSDDTTSSPHAFHTLCFCTLVFWSIVMNNGFDAINELKLMFLNENFWHCFWVVTILC